MKIKRILLAFIAFSALISGSAFAVGTAGTSVQMDIDAPTLAVVKQDIATFTADPAAAIEEGNNNGRHTGHANSASNSTDTTTASNDKCNNGKALGLTEDYGLGNNIDSGHANNKNVKVRCSDEG